MNDQPPSVPTVQKSGLATASLVLGIVGAVFLCFGIPFGIAALICGLMAQSRIKAAGGLMLGKGKATAGIILGIVPFVSIPIVGVLAGMLLPALGMAREKARTAACISNMKTIATAITLYADRDEQGRMPESLEALVDSGDLPAGSTVFTCPKSHRVYMFPGAGHPWQGKTVEIAVYCDEEHVRRYVVLSSNGAVQQVDDLGDVEPSGIIPPVGAEMENNQ